MTETFLTVAEIAELLKVNKQTVYNWIDRGSLSAIRVGRRVRIKQSEVDRILGTGANGADTSTTQGKTAPSSDPRPDTAPAVLARNRFAAALAETFRVAAGPDSHHLSPTLRALATAAQNLATALDPEPRPYTTSDRGELWPGAATGQDVVSHRVTTKDIEAGQIRIPPATKELFPTARAELKVRVRGTMLAAHWDPRVGPERPRAGLLRFGRGRLELLVGENDVSSWTSALAPVWTFEVAPPRVVVCVG
jgi:excisionase family DNA binding protein